MCVTYVKVLWQLTTFLLSTYVMKELEAEAPKILKVWGDTRLTLVAMGS